MNYRLWIEGLLVAALVFIVLVAFSSHARADCFPCFEDRQPQQSSVTIKSKKKKTIKQKNVSNSYVGMSHGMASYYWQPQKVASGGRFNPNAFTAAHRTLTFGTRVKVTNVRNGRSVVVTINDRGPFIKGRIIDLSLAAAKAIDMTRAGVVPVTVERQ